MHQYKHASVGADVVFTRRRLVAAGLAVGATASFTPAWADSQWEASVLLPAGEYQAAVNQMVSRGFRPAHINVANIGGEPRFSAIFTETDGRAWEARHDLTSAAYQTAFDRFLKQGYRPVRVCGYDKGGEIRYAAVWEKVRGPAFEARHNMTSAQYQKTFNDLVARGYQPRQLSGFNVGGQSLFAAIFEADRATPFSAMHDLNSRGYQAAFNQMNAKGYVLRQVSGYAGGPAPRFAAIWTKTPTPPQEARHNLTLAGLQATMAPLLAKGYRLADLSAYDVSGQARFAAFWLKD
ncbi:MAG: hypothetical protein Q8L66_14165 [Caulobacter sp.]|nr:hypothetical protein [Caulobacter sp.]